MPEIHQIDIFVFGSNTAGRHGAGAALSAVRAYGAKYGIGRGLQGRAYAIPTKDDDLNTLPLGVVRDEVVKFLQFADTHPQYDFLVTEIGCGLAGYSPEVIAPLFEPTQRIPDNVFLPIRFIHHLPNFPWTRASYDEHSQLRKRPRKMAISKPLSE